ncbi:MAG: MBL fold metallo-hydrolase [Lachnospiraceae bacterium]
MKLCSIASGSSGNCIFVGSEHTSLLVDAGISGKRVEMGLNEVDMTAKDLDGILVTHEHSDHMCGLGVLARRCHIPIYATIGTIDEIRKSRQVGEIPEELFREIREDEYFGIGDMQILPFAISHDAAQPVGYRLECGDKSIGIATDMGKYTEEIVEHLTHLDALLLEANHDINMLQVGKYPYYLKQRILGARGHLSNESAGQLLCRLLHDDLKAVFLGHLSKENNYEELAYETVCQEVTMGENPYQSRDFRIEVARRNCVSGMVCV